MENLSTFFGIFYGALFILASLSIVINRYSIAQVLGDIRDNHAEVLLAGVFSLFIGLMTVYFHPYYEIGWPLLITIVGWVAVAKATALFLMPTWLAGVAESAVRSKFLHSLAVAMFLLGALFMVTSLHVFTF